MTELLAVYAPASWFLDAFQVIGYLWPNGDRGSDKTQCLLLMSEFCHLGLVVQGGASFATLPDSALAGHTVVLLMARTADQRRANAEPLDFALWPHDRRRLVDDLRRWRSRPCQAPRAGGQGSRQWEVVVRDIAGLAPAYAVPYPELSREPPQPDASPASPAAAFRCHRAGIGASGRRFSQRHPQTTIRLTEIKLIWLGLTIGQIPRQLAGPGASPPAPTGIG